ncbi:MAG TPA: hypothetical protein VKE74_31745 [Gemmataceae bacterium]|nr:hypothetical protein [Gemmataceae bacterium]
MDEIIVGFWRVRSIDMVEDRAVSLVGGLPGEIVEFTSDGRYVLWGDPSRPSTSCCRTFRWKGRSALDVWIEGLEALTTRCIYQVEGPNLLVCIAGDSQPRPAEMKRKDARLWCLMSLERSEPPPKRRRAKSRKLLEPGRFIPKGLFGKPRAKRRKSVAG